MSVLIARITERLDALGLNPTSAASQAKLKPDFVRDILRGRVRDPSSLKLTKLAAVLECAPEYLLGLEREIGRAPSGDWVKETWGRRLTLTVRHELRAGHYVKRTVADPESYGREDVTPVLPYMNYSQWAERIMDDSANRYVPRGYVVQVCDADEMQYQPKDGDLVILEVTAEGGALVERSLRMVEDWSWAEEEGGRFVYELPSHNTRWDPHKIDTGDAGVAERVRVVGKVLRAYGTFPMRRPG